MTLPIVERLREVEDHADVGCAEAADTIEELVEALTDATVHLEGAVVAWEEIDRQVMGKPGELRALRAAIAKNHAILAKLNGAS
jgi:hypothetical protein